MQVTETTVRSILTRASGFLDGVTSHSLQPYRGCSFGKSLCGAYCYVQHNPWVTAGRPWGGFLEVRTNAAEAYHAQVCAERDWARARGAFSIFLSSSTDPFVPQEERYGVTRRILEAVTEVPPDALVVQTHTARVASSLRILEAVGARCRLQVNVSIETDRDALPGLPPHASPVEARLAACRTLRHAGLRTVVTVSPLLPIADPPGFFGRISECADAVILDHYIEGDGTPDGRRTARTPLPAAMAAVEPRSTRLEYREEMAAAARRAMPGRVGIGREGFAGRFT
jgi:DNA repair photolyase